MKLWRVISYFLALSIGAFCLSGIVFAEDDVKTIEVERLVLKDKEGEIRAELVIDGNMPTLRMYDETGKKGVELLVSEKGSSLRLFDKWGFELIVASEVPLSTKPYDPFDPKTWYRDSYVPDATEWKILNMTTVHNCSGWALTDKLVKTSFVINRISSLGDPDLKLRAFVNTATQPSWNNHLGSGRFSVSDREVRAAFLDAGNYVFTSIIQQSFYDVAPNDVEIVFYIQGFEVGTWYNSVMTLKGE
jgi:hypothetical protein